MSSDVSVCLSIKQQLYPLPPPGELTNGAPAPNKWLAAEMSKLGLILTLPHKLGPGWREQTASIVNSRAVNGTSQNLTVSREGTVLEIGTHVHKVLLAMILK